MKTVKAILGGALLGAGLFFVPFILIRVLLFAMLIGFLFRAFGRRRWGGRHGGFGNRNQFAFADYVRGMSDEEYTRFQKHFNDRSDIQCAADEREKSNK